MTIDGREHRVAEDDATGGTIDTFEYGSTGLRHSGGFVDEEFLPQLYGTKANKVFREMSDNEPIIGGILLAFDQVAGNLDWHIEPPDNADADDIAATDFIRSAWIDMEESWDTMLSNIMSMTTFGWSMFEVNYKLRQGRHGATGESKYTDNKIGWRSWSIRGQETLQRWEFGDNGSIEAMVQMDPSQGTVTTIPMYKSLLFRTSEFKKNPQGRSMLRNAYVPYFYLKRIREQEAIGFERDLAGLPMATVPAEWMTRTASDSQKSFVTGLAKVVQEVRRNKREGLVFPRQYDDKGQKTMDFELLNSGGQRQMNPDTAITRYKQEIAMSLLADFLTLGHEKVGSFALGTAKMDLWTLVVSSIAKSIADVVNKHAIEKLLRLNGIPYTNAPTLAFGKVTNVDLREIGIYLQALIAGGFITPDPSLEAWFRETMGAPAAEEQ